MDVNLFRKVIFGVKAFGIMTGYRKVNHCLVRVITYKTLCNNKCDKRSDDEVDVRHYSETESRLTFEMS